MLLVGAQLVQMSSIRYSHASVILCDVCAMHLLSCSHIVTAGRVDKEKPNATILSGAAPALLPASQVHAGLPENAVKRTE